MYNNLVEAEKAELYKFTAIDNFRELLSNIDSLQQSDYLVSMLTEQLRAVILDKLTAHIAGLDSKQPLDKAQILQSPAARKRVMACLYFFDAMTDIYEHDPYFQEAGNSLYAHLGGNNDAASFARFTLIGEQPELARNAVATFIREANTSDLTSEILPEVITNMVMRIPHENIQVLWSPKNS